jgi:hypothetical protein
MADCARNPGAERSNEKNKSFFTPRGRNDPLAERKGDSSILAKKTFDIFQGRQNLAVCRIIGGREC